MVVRTEWRISGRWLVKDQTEHICAGARRVCEHFEKRPHSVLTIRDEAQKLLLGALTAYIAWELWTFFSFVIRALARRFFSQTRSKPSGAIHPCVWQGEHTVGGLARKRCSHARHAERKCRHLGVGWWWGHL